MSGQASERHRIVGGGRGAGAAQDGVAGGARGRRSSMSGQASERHRIVVGVDGSDASEAALLWAADEAQRRAARLDAVIAWRPTAAIAPPAGHPSASTR